MSKRIILLLLLFCVICLASCGADESVSEDVSAGSEESKVTTSEDALGHESAYLSVDLFQFSIQIDEEVYKLPMLQNSFISDGWSISENDVQTLKAGYIESATLSKGETTFDIQVINPTKKELSFAECPVGRLSYDFSGTAQIYIADNFLLNDATKASITEKYGEPETTETHSDFSEITYGSRKTTGNYAKYLFRFDKSGKIIYFSIVNHYMPR